MDATRTDSNAPPSVASQRPPDHLSPAGTPAPARPDLAAIVDLLPDGLVLCDARRKILLANRTIRAPLAETGMTVHPGLDIDALFQAALGTCWLPPPNTSAETAQSDLRRLIADRAGTSTLRTKDNRHLEVTAHASGMSDTLLRFTDITPLVQRTNLVHQAETVVRQVETLAKIGYFVFNTATMSTTYVSPGLLKLATSMAPDEPAQSLTSLLARVHPDDRTAVERQVGHALERNTPLNTQFKAVTSQGKIQYLWLSDVAVEDIETGDIVRIGIIQDITDQHHREQAIRKSVALREAITDSALDCIITMDDAGIVRDFNPAAERTFGYPRTEAIGERLSDLVIPPALREAHEAGLERYLSTGKHNVLGKRIEVGGMHANGSEIPVELAITPIEVNGETFFAAYLRDISEKLQANEALRKSQENLARAQEIAHLGSWDWTLSTDEVQWSDEVYRIFGLEPGTPITFDTYAKQVHLDDLFRVRQAVDRTVHEQVPYEMEHRVIRPDGDVRVVQGRGMPIVGPSGAVESLVGTVLDITPLHRAQDEIRRARDEAEAANQAKSQFLATMSHEIRTPLNGVIGGLNLLMDTSLSAEQSSHARIALNAGESLLTIINDILDFSKIEAGHLALEYSDFAIDDLIHRVADVISPLAKQKGLPLHVEIDDAVPVHIHADATRIRQIVINLVSNAVKFTDAGSVSIHVTRLRKDGPVLRIAVTDTGIGITDTQRATLFQDFHQADASYARRFGGTGLGLAISKRLAEAMGGTIACDSVPGKGSTFALDLPVMPAHAIDDTALSDPDPETALKGRILLAEDSQTNAYVAKAFLKHHEVTIDHVGNGIEAVCAVRERPYDLILMDLSMPEMDGLTATREIRAAEPLHAHIPIIAMTANATTEDEAACRAAGMDDFLTKPVNKPAFIATLARWLDPGSDAPPRTDDPPADHRRPGAHAAIPDPSDLDLIDPRRIKESWADFDDEIRAQALALFVTEARTRVEALGTALDEADLETARREAHALKGSSGHLGAAVLSDRAKQIEDACAQDATDTARTAAAGLAGLADRTVAALRTALGSCEPPQ